ncbi:Uncharacterised protein [uncultured archaeon]|nr:Uncharacterised protein [uncultured archaeon]
MRFKILQSQSNLRQYRILSGAPSPRDMLRNWLSKRKV